MKKLLFLLLGLAIATNASARADLSKVSVKQLPKTTMTKQIQTSKISATTISGTKSVAQTQKLQPTTTAQMWNARIQTSLKGNKRVVPKSSIKAIISEQPEGEVKTYLRGGTALWYDSGVKVGNQSGTVQIVYAADGSTVYIKNMIYTCGDQYGDTWMQGTIQGNEIHVPLGQAIYTTTNWGDIVAVWGTSYVSDGTPDFSPDLSVTEAVYLIDGDVLYLQNTLPAAESDYPGYEGYGLSAYWEDDGMWDYVMEWNTTYTYTEGTAPTIITTDVLSEMYPDGGYVLYYNRVGEAIVAYSNDLYMDIQSGMVAVFIPEDFSKVYMFYPVYDVEVDAWVEGEFNEDGSEIHVPLGQYVYWDSENLDGLKLGWGSFVQNEGFTADATVTEAVYAMNWDDPTLSITLQNTSSVGTVAGQDLESATGLALVNSADAFGGYLNWSTAYYMQPGDPTDVTVEPAAKSAYVTWTDETESSTSWNLRYRKFIDADKYFWDFEEEMASDYSLPGGWTTIDSDGDGREWYHLNVEGGSFKTHSGQGHVTSASYASGALTPDNWLISPKVRLKGEVSFWAVGQDTNDNAEVFDVYVSTGDPNDVSSFVQISAGNETTTGEIAQFTYDLSAYEGQKGYVAIRHYNCTDQFRLNIDDITIGDPDAEATTEVAEWVYVYDLDKTEYTIEGLTPETDYEVQVQSANAGGTSDWTDIVEFTTLAETTDLYIMGQVNDQDWAADAGTLMAYDEETKVYTATVNIDGRGQEQENYFSFTTKLGANADDWSTIAPYRIGAVSDGSFWVTEDQLNKELGISYQTEPNAFRILGGEYKITVSLENMNVIIEKLAGPEPEVLRGDVNRDGFVTIGDVTDLIDHLLSSDLEEGEHFSPDNADTNLDETISIGDVTTLIDFLLSGAWPE